ncbi:MAG: WD40 repeat domain-containing protein [Patescibacteria group bacterium]|jgi:hypothetical protein
MLSDRAKKIIYISLFILATLLLGFLLYYFILRVPAVPPVNLNDLNQPGGVNGLPSAGANVNRPTYINVNGQLVPAGNINTTPPSSVSAVARGGLTAVKRINSSAITALTLASDGKNLQGYNPSDGKFYRYNADGTLTALSDEAFFDVQSVAWAPSGDKAILKYPDNSTVAYNFATKKQITFPKTWSDFDFSPDSEKLAFKNLGVDVENRWLSIAKDDGTGFRNLERLGDNEKVVDVNWSPSGQIVGTWTKQIDLERQYLYLIGQNQEQYPTTILEGGGYRGIWTPDSEHLLYSVYSSSTDLKPNLWLVTAKGETTGQLRINTGLATWADKCVFADSATAYCAVPQNLPSGAGLVPEVAASLPDDIYKIDITTNKKTLLAVPYGSYTVQNPTLSQDGKYLYFIDGNSKTLNQLRIK